MIAQIATLAAVVIAYVWRSANVRATTAHTLAHRRLGPDGIVIGGEGFVLERENAPAVLMLHGAGDTPQTLRYLGAHLHARGFHVVAPLLPAHGRSLRDFSRISSASLTAAVRSEYAALRTDRDWVAVVGLSMGGALSVQLAADHQDMPALALLAPYLAMPTRLAIAARLSRVWGVVIPTVRSGDGTSIHDPAERERGLAYGAFTAAAVRALYQTMRLASNNLNRVRAPTLMIQSREDNRITVADAERAFARIGAAEKRLEWISGAGHVITVDFGRDAVFDSVSRWLIAHCTTVEQV